MIITDEIKGQGEESKKPVRSGIHRLANEGEVIIKETMNVVIEVNMRSVLVEAGMRVYIHSMAN